MFAMVLPVGCLGSIFSSAIFAGSAFAFLAFKSRLIMTRTRPSRIALMEPIDAAMAARSERALVQFSKLRIAAAVAISLLLAAPASAQLLSTLEVVKTRGELMCGVSGQQPSFSVLNESKEWEGLDVDFCRAVAAAVLGDSTKVKFVPLKPLERFDVLRSGTIDLLAANTAHSLRADTGGVQFVVANYYDGQAFVVAKERNITNLAMLSGSTVCVLRGTAHEANMESWFWERKLWVIPVRFDDQNAMYAAFLAGRCAAVTENSTALAASIIRTGKAVKYLMLPGIISKSPLGPYVRRGDDTWLNVVKWTHYAMLEAEELGLAGSTVPRFDRIHDPKLLRHLGIEASDDHGLDAQLQATSARVRRLLGVTPGNGAALGLDERWAYNIIRQVGNYGESYERNMGSGSRLKFGRGVNALWTKGGLMYSMPLQ